MTKPEMLDRMQHWRADANAILALFDDKGSVPFSQKQNAQNKLNALLDELEAEYKRLSPMKVQAGLTDDERCFYHPVVNECFLALSGKARRNSTPDGKWRDALDDVLLCLGTYKPQMEN